jgi:hypothetical protein
MRYNITEGKFMSATPGARELPASAQFLQMLAGKWVSRAISAAADLGIADQLKDGPRTAAELAAACGAREREVYRLLRALASVGIFEERAPRQFAMTPLAEPLRSDVPDSLRNMARFTGMPMTWRAWEPLTDSIRTGKNGMSQIGVPNPFDYLRDHPEESEIFNAAMTDFSRQAADAVVEAYDFGRFRKLVDVAGGHGALLKTILARNPGLSGVLFDMPHVIEGARAGLPATCSAESGDFFKAVPAGGDAYLLKHIIHDWDDEPAAAILRCCRKAIAPDGRLILVEMVIPAGNEPHFGKLLDLEMLAIPGGLERTEQEFRQLFATAGFELTAVIPTPTPVSVIEGRPV